MVTVALSAPAAAGSNVTVIAQVALTANPLPQVFVCENELAPVPEIAIELIVNAALPVFLTVTLCVGSAVPTSELANVSEVGESVATGAGVTPVPDKAIVEALEVLSVIVNEADNAPAAVGSNVTVTTHEAPIANPDPHVFDSENELAPVPEIAMELIVSAALPEFLTVTL
jgi:hypothetical protein